MNNEEIKDTMELKDVSVDKNPEFYSGFNPLDEKVNEKEYSKPNIDTSKGFDSELEEPTFQPPNFDEFEGEQEEEASSFNPAMDNLDKKEQMYATEQMVDTVLDVYGKAHGLANKFTRIKEDKIAQAMQDGEINPSLQVPIDERGNTLGVMEYVQEYNSQLEDVIKLEDDFVEKVKPPMVRVFQKRGLAMTDEQFLAVTFGTDLLTKGAMVFQLVKQNNKLFDMWKEQSNYVPRPSKTKSEPQPKSTPPPPPPSNDQGGNDNSEAARPTEFEEPEEFSAKSMVDDMMGMQDESNFQSTKQDDNMPSFGDPNMLSQLEKLSKESEVIDVTDLNEKPKAKKRGRPKKSK